MEVPQQIILFPFLAQGHIFPFLNLAKHLEQHTRKHNRNTVITLVSTPVNVAKLHNSISGSSCIKLVEFPFSVASHGIQPGIESTESIPFDQFHLFFEATVTSLRPSFEGLIAGLINQGQSKICIIADYFVGWTVEVAEKYNIPNAVFLTGGPYGMAVWFSLAMHPPPHAYLLRASPTEMTSLVDHPEMIELAKGLEASGRPFIWVIRPPSEFEDGVEEGEFREEWLPQGFEANITEKAQGILVHRWAPQMEILSHVSTGAFLCHCGWNSVLESLCEGVPIIGWPLVFDQLYTSSMLQEMGLAIEIARGRLLGGLIKGSQAVKEAVDMVLNEEEGCGSKMREKVREIKDVIQASVRDDTEFVGSSCKAMEAFLEAMFDV